MEKVISLRGYRRDRLRSERVAYNESQYGELKALLEAAARRTERRRRRARRRHSSAELRRRAGDNREPRPDW